MTGLCGKISIYYDLMSELRYACSSLLERISRPAQ